MKSAGLKNLFIANNNNKLIASISGGDLRNALLKGRKLSDQVFPLANYNPKFVYSTDKKNLKNKLEKLFKVHKLELIPILDQKKSIKNVIAWADFIRTKIAGKKRRYTLDGYNLDLTYVCPRIIAMSFPGSGT